MVGTQHGATMARRRRIPGQLVRLGILFALLAGALLYVRGRFVPLTFGELGHYRAAAIGTLAAQSIRFAGMEACAECHDDVAAVKQRSYHRGLSCEGCHGAASAHVEDPLASTPAIPKERQRCLRCHRYLASRPTGFPQVLERVHHPVKACVECHDPHDPAPPIPPSECAACHGAIARTKAVSHHWSLDCEQCHAAPAEHRQNPRAFLPKKPTERAFCGQCHARGSDAPVGIPRVDLAEHGGRYLCWQCHYPHAPEGG